MKAIVEVMAKALVEDPDNITINETEDDRGLLVELRVPEHDMGRVIGKQGRTAKAMRSIVKAAGMRTGQHVWIDIDVLEK
jgi:hypothetical protein